MARLTRLLLAIAWLVPAGAAPAESPADWAPHVAEASRRFGVPRPWLERVIQAESGGRTMSGGRPITSPAGAMGLMQLMPATWAEMRDAHGLGDDPHDPRDNILAGAAYLKAMLERFGHPGLFAAYHAGPGRFAEHLATGRRLPAETIAYVAKIQGGGPPAHEAGPPPPALFAIVGPGPAADAPGARAGASLFVPLDVQRPR